MVYGQIRRITMDDIFEIYSSNEISNTYYKNVENFPESIWSIPKLFIFSFIAMFGEEWLSMRKQV